MKPLARCSAGGPTVLEVRAFVAALPVDARDELSGVEKALTKVGREAVAHARNHTFHYPAPKSYDSDAALADVLASLASAPLEFAEVEGRPGRVRYVFADRAALRVALGKHRLDDEAAYRAQVEDLQRGATHFVNFVARALEAHLYKH